MTVRIMSFDDAPEPHKGRKSQVTQMPEWRELLTKLANGLKPFEEAAVVTFPVSKESGRKTILQTFKRTLQAYLKNLKLTDYAVSAFLIEDGATNCIVVKNIPVISGLKAMPKSEKRHRVAQ
jgi:hypothetical protein